MTFAAWFTIAVLVLTLGILLLELWPAEGVLLGALTALMLAGVISVDEAVAGFGSPTVLGVAALLVIAAGMRRTGLLTALAEIILGGGGPRQALWRIMGACAALSAFLANTPIVAMFAPAVLDWCKRRKVAPSRILMPLSFATILGGLCTLIGTSTNLVVDGLLRDAGLPGLGMFELAPLGVPVCIAGVVTMGLFAHRLLPDRTDPLANLGADRRAYLVEMLVEADSPLIGKTIAEAGLRNLGGLFLMNVERAGDFLGPVRPSERLRPGDRLVFTGVAQTVVELRRFAGLTPAPETHYDPTAANRRDRLYEAVVSGTSPLIGTTVKDAGFRRRYDAAVIAVHRSGQRLTGKIGEVELRPGDTLLLEASEDFYSRWSDGADFALISRLQAEPQPLTRHVPLALTLLGGFVLVVSLELLPLVAAAFMVIGLMFASKMLGAREARRAVDLAVVISIAASLGLGKALSASGAASLLGGLLSDVAAELGARGLLVSIYVSTAILTAFLSNAAAVALVFPIVVAASTNLGVDPRAGIITMTIAASADFLTPTGYQTNLMVYGPGGYRFSDFARLGAPVTVVVGIVTVLVVPLVW